MAQTAQRRLDRVGSLLTISIGSDVVDPIPRLWDRSIGRHVRG
jgi:hypothetical protein